VRQLLLDSARMMDRNTGWGWRLGSNVEGSGRPTGACSLAWLDGWVRARRPGPARHGESATAGARVR
jgi:hypothetical protein